MPYFADAPVYYSFFEFDGANGAAVVAAIEAHDPDWTGATYSLDGAGNLSVVNPLTSQQSLISPGRLVVLRFQGGKNLPVLYPIRTQSSATFAQAFVQVIP